MNKNYRIVFLCITVLILSFKFFRFLNHNVGPSTIRPEVLEVKDSIWTDDYKAQVKNAIYAKADSMLVLPGQKEEIAECVTKRFKNLFPRGLDKIPKDSLHLLSQRAFASCIKDMGDSIVVRKWTSSQEQAIRTTLQKSLATSTLTPAVKDKYCDCIVNVLHKKYAKGIVGHMSQKEIKAAAASCVKQAFGQ